MEDYYRRLRQSKLFEVKNRIKNEMQRLSYVGLVEIYQGSHIMKRDIAYQEIMARYPNLIKDYNK